MHKLILFSFLLSAAEDAEKTGSNAFQESELLTPKRIEKYQQSIYLPRWIRWRANFVLTPEDCFMSWSAVAVNSRLHTVC